MGKVRVAGFGVSIEGPARTRAWSIRSANRAGNCTVGPTRCTVGPTRRGPFDRWSDKTAGLTIASPAPRRKASAPSSINLMQAARLSAKRFLSRTMKVLKMQIYQLGILRISRELVRGNRRLSA
jgi:hypothetical protein